MNYQIKNETNNQIETPLINKTNFVFLNTKEVTQMLGCSIPLARKLMHREGFPLIKVGTKFKVYAPALDEWARGHRV